LRNSLRNIDQAAKNINLFCPSNWSNK
jgi:hypothetical protein